MGHSRKMNRKPAVHAGRRMTKRCITRGIALFGAVLLLCLCRGEPLVAATNIKAEKESRIAERILRAQKQIRNGQGGRYGMVPVYGCDVADGEYPIEVLSSSVFFRITDATLIVQEHQMSARITLSSVSYLYCYPGTGQEAEKAGKENYIGYEEKDGHSVFTIPVRALDTGISCAAFSRKRERWYDRTLIFDASSLPEEALSFPLPDYEAIEAAIRSYDTSGADAANPEGEETEGEDPVPVEVTLEDGDYSIEVNMTGGSGRASISSPTLLTVRDRKAYARLLWSSTYYDYLILDGTYYYNLTQDGGNSTFMIPITVMDEPIQITADTTAMGDPVEISYALTFYEESIGAKGQIPQEAAKKVLIIAAVIMVVGWFLNAFVQKKRRQ